MKVEKTPGGSYCLSLGDNEMSFWMIESAVTELRDHLSKLLPSDPTDWKRAYESKLLYIGMLEIDRNQLHTKCKVLANELQAKERELYSVKNGATYHLAKSFTQPDYASPIIPYEPPASTLKEEPAIIRMDSFDMHMTQSKLCRKDPVTALRGNLERDTLESGVKPADSALSRAWKGWKA